jgi:hypothetical protein
MATQRNSKAFLQRVATDPAFRAQVEKDPVGSLAQFGFDIKSSDVPPEGIKLPSNDAILKNIDSLSTQMDSTVGEIFFKL